MTESLPASWECVLDRAAVEAGVERLASRIQPCIDAGPCVLMGVMTGGMYPLIRLIDHLQGDFMLDYCHATRYGDALKGGGLEWIKEPGLDMSGRTLIIVDDIWDEGYTLTAVAERCAGLGAERVLTAVLFIKDRARDPALQAPDLDAGLHVPDRYVFGCGMDMKYRWRHLPAVYALTESDDEAQT